MITAVNVVKSDVPKVEVKTVTNEITNIYVPVKELSVKTVNEALSPKEHTIWATVYSTLSANEIKRAEGKLARHDHLRNKF